MKNGKFFGALTLLFAFALAGAGCTDKAPSGGEPTDTGTQTPPEPETPQSAAYVVESALELQRLTGLHDGDTVLMKGFYLPGDGGGGMFVWDEGSAAEIDGGTVFGGGSDTGRFVRDCEPNYRNVRWFGAVGSGSTDDTEAIQRAIDSLPASGGTVSVPGGNYRISQPLQIGNGDGANRHSTVNGIRLIGEGGGFASGGTQYPTRLTAAVPMETMLSVNGKISDVVLQDMFIDGNYMAESGIVIQAASGLTVTDISVGVTLVYGIQVLGGSGIGTENKLNRFETVSVYAVEEKTICLYMDGATESTPGNSMTTFVDCRFDTAQTENSYAVWMRSTTGTDFYRCHFNTYRDSSTGLVLDATNCHGYPYGNVFYDCSIVSVAVQEDQTGYIGRNFFYGYGTYDLEDLPEHPMLSGITDAGIPFNLGS